jgi:hypothetical protein
MLADALEQKIPARRLLQTVAGVSGITSIISWAPAGQGLVSVPEASVIVIPMRSAMDEVYSMTISTAPTEEPYNPALVAAVIEADAKKPEAKFDNVIDMMEWLETN